MRVERSLMVIALIFIGISFHFGALVDLIFNEMGVLSMELMRPGNFLQLFSFWIKSNTAIVFTTLLLGMGVYYIFVYFRCVSRREGFVQTRIDGFLKAAMFVFAAVIPINFLFMAINFWQF